MANPNLFDGIAVIIDDQIGKEEKEINNLIQQIEKANMPYLTYTGIPDIDEVRNFEGVSFLLFDWKLQTEHLSGTIEEGVKIPDALSKSWIADNISFLKGLSESCFVPVFIFTNENPEIVIRVLKENDLYQDDKPNSIFVKSKGELTGTVRFFRAIEKWINQTPSIYVLKVWEKEYRKAKNQLFREFYSLSPFWPNILWINFKDDRSNMSQELGDVITKNLYSRMAPFSFDDSKLKKISKKPEKDEVRSVLEGERFIKATGLDNNSISTGDVFKVPSKQYIYLNIRPDCDCIPDRNNTDSGIEDVELYLLKGSKLTGPKEQEDYNTKYGHFNEMDSQAIVFNMVNGKTYDFRFKKLKIVKWGDIKDNRIGRLLPPYITRIQQRYALYIQRQGLPRIPEMAVV